MLKTDMHMHSSEDPFDGRWIKHNAKELIDAYAREKYDVISITNHNQVLYTSELVAYAKEKGIFLIPGVERTIEGYHVLIYNITQEQSDSILKFDDLFSLRSKDVLIVAPHPYFPMGFSLRNKVEKYISIFDAFEYNSNFHTFFNFNRKAVRVAAKYNLPVISNCDLHEIDRLGTCYSLIDSEKEISSFFEAIRKHKIEIVTQSLSILTVLNIPFKMVLHYFQK